MIQQIAKCIVALNGNVKREQIAAGFAWGLLLALVPAGVFWAALFLISFFLRHNHGSKLLVMVVCKLLMPLAAAPLDALGWAVLHLDGLQPLFTELYNMPFVPFTRFNNTLVAGGLVGGLVLWVPVFFSALGFVTLYRATLAPALRNLRLVKFIANIPFVSSLGKALSGSMNKGA
jgi:uncharacterized protein (TIGR03546 family)